MQISKVTFYPLYHQWKLTQTNIRPLLLKGYGAQLAASVAREDREGEGGGAASKKDAEGGRGDISPKSVSLPLLGGTCLNLYTASSPRAGLPAA